MKFLTELLVVLLALVAGIFVGRESLRVWPTPVDQAAVQQPADPFDGLKMRIIPLPNFHFTPPGHETPMEIPPSPPAEPDLQDLFDAPAP